TVEGGRDGQYVRGPGVGPEAGAELLDDAYGLGRERLRRHARPRRRADGDDHRVRRAGHRRRRRETARREGEVAQGCARPVAGPGSVSRQCIRTSTVWPAPKGPPWTTNVLGLSKLVAAGAPPSLTLLTSRWAPAPASAGPLGHRRKTSLSVVRSGVKRTSMSP